MKKWIISLCVACIGFLPACILTEKKEEIEIGFDVDEFAVKAFIHCWNMEAHANKSLVRFYDKTNMEGIRKLVVVNVDVDYKDDESVARHKIFLQQLQIDWFNVSNSNIINIYNSSMILVMWTDEYKQIHVKKREAKNV